MVYALEIELFVFAILFTFDGHITKVLMTSKNCSNTRNFMVTKAVFWRSLGRLFALKKNSRDIILPSDSNTGLPHDSLLYTQHLFILWVMLTKLNPNATLTVAEARPYNVLWRYSTARPSGAPAQPNRLQKY
ncbi:hypothetical protein OUZ56_021665 [Daphnia magna]|uniref:Secreted protein n=1 Tax=Daphnia magna TaxID=35525 RepID=A0ABR0AU48_9CRUS|nr:hypothetical protein OUZ56_021665 [Daphnia magna]